MSFLIDKRYLAQFWMRQVVVSRLIKASAAKIGSEIKLLVMETRH